MLLAVVKPLKSGTATPPQATEVFSLSQEISCIFSRVKFKLLFSSSACAPQQQRNSNWGGCFVKPQHEATEPQLPVLKPLSAPWLSSFPAHTTFPSGSRESSRLPAPTLGPRLPQLQGYFSFCPTAFYPHHLLQQLLPGPGCSSAPVQLSSSQGNPQQCLPLPAATPARGKRGILIPPHPLWASPAWFASPGALSALSRQLLSESQTKPFPVHRSLFIPPQMLPCKNHSKINALPFQWLSTITCGSSCQQL